MVLADGTVIEHKNINISELNSNIVDIVFVTDDYTKCRNLFKNKDAIYKIVDGENEYIGFTDVRLFHGSEIEGGLTEITVSLVYEGLSKEVDNLKSQLDSSYKEIEMLTGAIMEMSELIYN